MENEQEPTQNAIDELLAHLQAGFGMDYKHRTIIDDRCIGLRFVASPYGTGGNWVRRFKNKAGKMKQYQFAEYPETSIYDARNYVEQVRGHDHPTITSPYGEHTIGHLVDVYLNEYVKIERKDQGYRNAKSALTRNLKPIMTKKLDQVSANTLHEIILTVKKRTPHMAHELRSELKQAWAYALASGITSIACPITSMTGGRFKRVARDRILTDAEISDLLNNLDRYSQALADVIVVCLYTGLRSGEVAAIHARELAPYNGLWWLDVPKERMKNGLAHRIPMIGPAEQIITRRVNDHPTGHIFPMKRKKEKPMTQATLAREIYQIHGGDWRLHDLRRTTRTNLQRMGCPFEVSETILAHKLPGVSAVYARYQYNDEKIHWLTQLANYYGKYTK